MAPSVSTVAASRRDASAGCSAAAQVVQVARTQYVRSRLRLGAAQGEQGAPTAIQGVIMPRGSSPKRERQYEYIIADRHGEAAALLGHRYGTDPVGEVVRNVLVEEGLSQVSVGIALHPEWPVLEVGEHGARDGPVVVDQLGLGDPVVREQLLVGVGQRRLPVADAYLVLGLLLGAHGFFLAFSPGRSRTTSGAGPSVPGPMDRGWRGFPSSVRSVNPISATSCGRIHGGGAVTDTDTVFSTGFALGDPLRVGKVALRHRGRHGPGGFGLGRSPQRRPLLGRHTIEKVGREDGRAHPPFPWDG